MIIKRMAPKGFSLIEMVVYIAILVLMLTVVIQVIFSVVRANRVVQAGRNIERSALSSLERMSREVHQAGTIDTSESVFGSALGVLSLDGEDIDGNSRAVKFSLSSGQVRLLENGADVGALSVASATVSSLIFTRFYGTSTEGVRIQMTIESGTSTAYRAETFHTSALIR